MRYLFHITLIYLYYVFSLPIFRIQTYYIFKYLYYISSSFSYMLVTNIFEIFILHLPLKSSLFFLYITLTCLFYIFLLHYIISLFYMFILHLLLQRYDNSVLHLYISILLLILTHLYCMSIKSVFYNIFHSMCTYPVGCDGRIHRLWRNKTLPSGTIVLDMTLKSILWWLVV